RRRHTRFSRDWSSDVCSSDLKAEVRGRSAGVFPTSVGVFPPWCRSACPCPRLPHVRGGVYKLYGLFMEVVRSSQRPWVALMCGEFGRASYREGVESMDEGVLD